MKKLDVNFSRTTDTTGYLFSLAKCLSAALACSKYRDYADDIIASSGFAFRMWVAPDLCPSATSIWEFKKQKPWIENGGLLCDYVERLWGEEAVEEERRLQAVELVKKSIDGGCAAVVWDISGCEWGCITGYNDETRFFAALKINGEESTVPYDSLGRLELPILSVAAVTGEVPKNPETLLADTKKLALAHLEGKEWCDNAKGLAAYDTLIGFVREKLTADTWWNLEYYLGTYAALKWYAWKFFAKYGEGKLAEDYRKIHEAWQEAFELKCVSVASDSAVREKIVHLLESARQLESVAAEKMKE